MNDARDPLDDLEEWINDVVEELDAEEAEVEIARQPVGFMTVYDDNGKPFHGKIFDNRESADNAMTIMSGMMKPLFRVNVYRNFLNASGLNPGRSSKRP